MFKLRSTSAVWHCAWTRRVCRRRSVPLHTIPRRNQRANSAMGENHLRSYRPSVPLICSRVLQPAPPDVVL